MEFDEYVKRFPINLRNALSIPKHKDRFNRLAIFEYEDIDVYRAIKDNRYIDSNDFQSSFDLKFGTIDDINMLETVIKNNNCNIDTFSISVNEDIDSLKKSLKFPNKRYNGIAEGKMRCKYGPADFTGTTHHNWYIYSDSLSSVIKDFKIVYNNKWRGVQNGIMEKN